MNRISIESDNIQLLTAFLEKTITDISFEIENNKVIIYPKNKVILEKVSLALSIFIILSIEEEFTEKAKKSIPLEKYNKEIFLSIQDEYKKFLYIDPVKILILEHLKTNSKIVLDSFKIFNCRGLQKEFYSSAKDYLQLYLEEFKNEIISSSNNLKSSKIKAYEGLSIDSAITYYSYIKELNDLIFKLKEEVNSNFDYKRFNEVHVKSNGENIVLTDNENKLISNELNNILPINIVNSLQGGDEILKTAITLITYISILKTSCVVIHKSIPDESINRILLYLYDSREVNPELFNVNLLQCNTCSMCNLITT